jgi:DNA-binding response OmpR family regulator
MNRRRILIVDDDMELSRMLKMGIEQSGPYEVRVENDPRRAKSVALAFMPELLLMDVIMPWMDGGSVVAEIRQEETLKKVAVIFLTSILNKDEAAAHGNRIGNDPVLAKPVSVGEIMRRIEGVLPVK